MNKGHVTQKTAAAAPGSLRKKPVLVIDAETAVVQALDILLDMWGYRVVAAADESEAVARLAGIGEPLHAVLATYRLRDGSTGPEAIARIRQLAGGFVPGLVITGDSTIEELREAEADGMIVLQKPVLPQHLQALLEAAALEDAA